MLVFAYMCAFVHVCMYRFIYKCEYQLKKGREKAEAEVKDARQHSTFEYVHNPIQNPVIHARMQLCVYVGMYVGLCVCTCVCSRV